MLHSGIGEANASFGEIIQGNRFVNQKSFLVTLPIDLKSIAYFIPTKSNKISVFPKYKRKVIKSIEILGEKLGCDISGIFIIESEIPEGKGLSSSSADLVAAIRAYCNFANITISNKLIGEVISSVEPSDAVMYEGITLFYNKEGKCGMKFDYVPSLTIVAIDEGGVVDTTLCYIERAKQTREIFFLQDLLVEELSNALSTKNVKMICQICTQSAIINQSVLPKKNLSSLLELVNKYNLSIWDNSCSYGYLHWDFIG